MNEKSVCMGAIDEYICYGNISIKFQVICFHLGYQKNR